MFSLIPKEMKFFDMFELGAHNLLKGAKVLKDIADNLGMDINYSLLSGDLSVSL